MRPSSARTERFATSRRTKSSSGAATPNRLFLLEEGLCGYFVAGETTGHAAIMSLLLPGTTLCDMTSSVGRRCNVETRAIEKSRVWVAAPDFYERHVFTDPELALEKYQHAVEKQESTLEGMIANFTLPPEQRVKILLKAVLGHEGRLAGDDWVRIPYDLPAETIGQTVNLTRQTVARVIGDWRRAGLAAARDGTLKSSLRSLTTSTTGSSTARGASPTGIGPEDPGARRSGPPSRDDPLLEKLKS